MRRIGMGIVGLGFAGAQHIDAVRRLGNVDIVGVAGSSQASAQKKADEFGIPKAFASYEEMIADPQIQVIHNTSENYLHAPVNMAVISRGKHIISDKPLAISSSEARQLRDAAQKAGVVNAVTFNYRGNPMVQQARSMIAKGELGPLHFIHGIYLQDWLLEASDYSWRLEPERGGRSLALADIGSHWCDLAQHLSGLRIKSVLAELATVVKIHHRPLVKTQTFQKATAGNYEEVEIKGDDLASVLIRFDNGARGSFSVGQVCAGHKNDLWVELNGKKQSLRWNQEKQNELWIGTRNEGTRTLPKDPSQLDPAVRKYAHLPGGHQEGWPDALFNQLKDIYSVILGENTSAPAMPLSFASFEDGYRANCLVDAMFDSYAAGGVWKEVNY
jgi:predicted dehydrogenase